MTDGILIVDKPPGWTSHDVVARVRRLFGERRVGHTGTLDPFATGVLVLLLGRATRLAQFLSGAEKEYEATIRFGYATETGDATGARRTTPETSTTPETPSTPEASSMPETPSTPESLSTLETSSALDCAAWGEAQIESALATLRGEFEQVPPMYSAKKVKGKKLYELARQGLEIERKAVRVFVPVFEARRLEGRVLREGEAGTCELSARVVCSAGTYVRVLAESLGERLGVGAHLSALRRTRAGAFRIEQAHTLEDLAATAGAGGDALAGKLLSLDAALSMMPEAHLTAEESRRARHGAALSARAARSSSSGGSSIVEAASLRDGERVRLCDERGQLIAVGEYDEAGERLHVVVLLVAEGK